jgi:predicted ATPase/transcriptional regulator with XRE-family HTH domain
MDEFIYMEAGVTAQPSFGQWLKLRRKALDLTREDLAQQVGCAAITLKKIEADERRPSRQIAELFAEHLNIPPDERPAFVRFARADAGGDAAPWSTPFHPPTNLPTQPIPLIGRDAEVAALRKRLLQPKSRLLTLTGPPGIGKTRLALAVAAETQDDFADGVFVVLLAPISDASLILPTVASTLGVPEGGPQTSLERLKVFLRDKQMLLVLDNFEQILAAAPQIADLLAACPWLKLLVTSRAPLRIRNERQIPVSPLDVPDLARLPEVENLTDYSAMTLFLERAQAVKPDFALTEANAPTVAALCARLDGLPLAIELISARIKLLSPTALLERLGGRLMLQSDGLRDLEPRHRTLNAAIDWSYQLLSIEEQMLFRRLAVFVGGWTLEAAEAVCMENLELTVLDGLASLLDKNLVKQGMRADGEPRFMMLETIREYALEQLVASRALDDLRQRHIDYFLKLAEEAEAHAFGHEQIAWFDRLEVESDNLRAALTSSLESETGLRLAGALGWFFSERAYSFDGLIWLVRVLEANPNASDSLRSKAFHSAGALAGLQGDQRARVLCEQALALARSANDRWNIAWSLSHLGFMAEDDPVQKASRLEESLAWFREIEDPMGLSHTLLRRAWVAIDFQRDYPYARSLLEESSIIAREAGDRVITAWVFYSLGKLSWLHDHDLRQAKNHFETSLAFFREARFQLGTVLHHLAAVEQALGDLVRAQLLYEEAVIFSGQSMPHPVDLAGLASLARAHGQLRRAATLLGTIDESVMPFMAAFYPPIVTYESDKAFVRDQLGETAFAEAWAAGKAMSPAQVIAYALDQTD